MTRFSQNQVEYLAALQTISGCERCTTEFRDRISTNPPTEQAGRDNTGWYDSSAGTATQNNRINLTEVNS